MGRPAEGIEAAGGRIEYKANAQRIVTEGQGDSQRAVGVQLNDGRVYRGKVGLAEPPMHRG